MALIEIDGLPINSMVDLSSSQTVSHNQRVKNMICYDIYLAYS